MASRKIKYEVKRLPGGVWEAKCEWEGNPDSGDRVAYANTKEDAMKALHAILPDAPDFEHRVWGDT